MCAGAGGMEVTRWTSSFQRVEGVSSAKEVRLGMHMLPGDLMEVSNNRCSINID